MCGGYYEEEIMEDMKFTTAENMMKELSSRSDEGAATEGSKYYGPSTQFASTQLFGRAAAICELENIECNLDPYENRINFKSMKEEERFTIAWSKAVAGSQR